MAAPTGLAGGSGEGLLLPAFPACSFSAILTTSRGARRTRERQEGCDSHLLCLLVATLSWGEGGERSRPLIHRKRVSRRATRTPRAGKSSTREVVVPRG